MTTRASERRQLAACGQAIADGRRLHRATRRERRLPPPRAKGTPVARDPCVLARPRGITPGARCTVSYQSVGSLQRTAPVSPRRFASLGERAGAKSIGVHRLGFSMLWPPKTRNYNILYNGD